MTRDADGWERNRILIPMTEEMLMDAGFCGPRYRQTDPSGVWTQRHHDATRASLAWPWFQVPTAWQFPDRPWLDLAVFPSLDRITAVLDDARRRWWTARSRLREAWSILRDGPVDPDD